MGVRIKKTAIVFICFTLVLHGGPLGASPFTTRQPGPANANVQGIRDVAMVAPGTMRGQLVNRNGDPLAQTVIGLIDNAGKITTSRTDSEGWFQASVARGGVYQLVANDSVTIIRAWQPGTAPPGAAQSALVVSDETVVRGLGPFGKMLFHPWLIAGMAFAGIVVPLALDDGGASL